MELTDDVIAVLEGWGAHRTGLAPHYPFIYFTVIGMRAQRVFEFGAGESSRLIARALATTGGRLHSVSPDGQAAATAEWTHHMGLSAEIHRTLPRLGPFDLVLHDGSHSADVVTADLLAVLPCVKQWGLVLVHDGLHSYVGDQVMRGIIRARNQTTVQTDRLTLPFAFGLTIIKVQGNEHLGSVIVDAADKPSSQHYTQGPLPGPTLLTFRDGEETRRRLRLDFYIARTRGVCPACLGPARHTTGGMACPICGVANNP